MSYHLYGIKQLISKTYKIVSSSIKLPNGTGKVKCKRHKISYVLWAFILYSEMMWWAFHNEVYFGLKNKSKSAFSHYVADTE